LHATVDEEKGNIGSLSANVGIGKLAQLGGISENHFNETFGINVKGFCSVLTTQPRWIYARSLAHGQSN
jgi:hypothetical protein